MGLAEHAELIVLPGRHHHTVHRDGNGYRIYDDNALEQARTVLKQRRVGLSLPEVTAAMSPYEVGGTGRCQGEDRGTRK